MLRRGVAVALACGAIAAPAVWAGPAPPPDTDVPHVTGTKLTRTTFRVGRGAPELLAARAGTGTTITYFLSEPSRVEFRVERASRGRWLADGVFSFDSTVGRNQVHFFGRFANGRVLRPGKHRIALTPTDAAGNRGAFQRRRFTIVQ
jgi:hypothetical protein